MEGSATPPASTSVAPLPRAKILIAVMLSLPSPSPGVAPSDSLTSVSSSPLPDAEIDAPSETGVKTSDGTVVALGVPLVPLSATAVTVSEVVPAKLRGPSTMIDDHAGSSTSQLAPPAPGR